MYLIYQGDSDAVELDAGRIVARKGEPVEVPDDLAESLIEQGWKKSRKTTTPAGENESED